jgi:hypothetical protein
MTTRFNALGDRVEACRGVERSFKEAALFWEDEKDGDEKENERGAGAEA